MRKTARLKAQQILPASRHGSVERWLDHYTLLMLESKRRTQDMGIKPRDFGVLVDAYGRVRA